MAAGSNWRSSPRSAEAYRGRWLGGFHTGTFQVSTTYGAPGASGHEIEHAGGEQEPLLLHQAVLEADGVIRRREPLKDGDLEAPGDAELVLELVLVPDGRVLRLEAE